MKAAHPVSLAPNRKTHWRKPTTVSIEPAIRDAATKLVEEHGLSLSQYVERLIAADLAARGREVTKAA